MTKSEDLSRSLEIKTIWTFDTEFTTIFNKSCTYITFKSAVKHRQLSYGYPRRQTVNLAFIQGVFTRQNFGTKLTGHGQGTRNDERETNCYF